MSSGMSCIVPRLPWRKPCRRRATSVRERKRRCRRVNERSRRRHARSGKNADTSLLCQGAGHDQGRRHRRRHPHQQTVRDWILAARPDIRSTSGSTATTPKPPSPARTMTLVVLDIELGRERHAGVADHQRHQQDRARHAGAGGLGDAGGHLPQHHEGAGRLGLPAENELRGADFIETFLEILRASPGATGQAPSCAAGQRTVPRPAAPEHTAVARPARQSAAHRAAHPGHPLPAARRGGVLRRSVPGGEERAQPRQHPQAHQHHPRSLPRTRRDFDRIENVPMRGFRWSDSGRCTAMRAFSAGSPRSACACCFAPPSCCWRWSSC
jgi:hypothetical protein